MKLKEISKTSCSKGKLWHQHHNKGAVFQRLPTCVQSSEGWYYSLTWETKTESKSHEMSDNKTVFWCFNVWWDSFSSCSRLKCHLIPAKLLSSKKYSDARVLVGSHGFKCLHQDRIKGREVEPTDPPGQYPGPAPWGTEATDSLCLSWLSNTAHHVSVTVRAWKILISCFKKVIIAALPGGRAVRTLGSHSRGPSSSLIRELGSCKVCSAAKMIS